MAKAPRLGSSPLRERPPVDLSDEAQLSGGRAGIGDNQGPPLEMTDGGALRLEQLLERYTELTRAGNTWLKLGSIKSQEESDNLAGYRKQVRELRDEAAAICKLERQVHLDKAKAIAGAFEPIGTGCQLNLDRTEPMQRAWLQAEKDRMAREAEEKRQAAEAKQREAEELARAAERADLESGMEAAIAADRAAKEAKQAAKVAEQAEKAKPRAGGQYVAGGVKRSEALRPEWSYAVNNVGQALAWWIGPRKKVVGEAAQAFQADLEALILAHVRKAHAADRTLEFPGVTITEGARAR